MKQVYLSAKNVAVAAMMVGITFSATAQNNSTVATFATGGSFSAEDNKVEFFLHSGNHGQIMKVGEAFGDFNNAVIREGEDVYGHVGRGFAHPLGKDIVVKYNVAGDNVEAIDTLKEVGGLNGMTIIGDYLVATFGFGATGSYVQVFDKNDLSKPALYSDEQITANVGGFTIMEDIAFFSFTQNDTGKIAGISFEDNEISPLGVFELDTLSSGIGALVNDGFAVYALSNKYDQNFSKVRSTVTKLDEELNYQTVLVPNASGAIGINNGLLYANFGQGLGSMSTDSLVIIDSTINGITYSGGSFDAVNDHFVLLQTDYFSFGNLLVIDADSNVIFKEEVPISGSAISNMQVAFPMVMNDSASAQAGAEVLVDVLGNDDLNPSLTSVVTMLSTPAQGTAEIDSNWALYTADSAFAGADTFKYFVSTLLFSDSGSVYINEEVVSAIRNILNLEVSLAPNPVVSDLNLSFGEDFTGTVSVISIDGRTVLSQEVYNQNAVKLNASNLPKGVYVVAGKSVNGAFAAKFIKK